MTFGSECEGRRVIQWVAHSSVTFQIDRHLTEKIIGFEPIVVPESELEFLVLHFFAMQVTVDDGLIPHWIQRLRYVFDSTFILLPTLKNERVRFSSASVDSTTLHVLTSLSHASHSLTST